MILLVGSLLSALAAPVSRELVTSHRSLLEAADGLAIASVVFEGTVQGVVISNPEGLVLSLNQSFTQLTGYINIDLRGKSRIQAELRPPFTGLHGSEVLRISVSVGIARWPEHGANIDALMQAADRAMDQSKQSVDKNPVMAESPTTTSAAA